MQTFPEPPSVYRVQESEPDLSSARSRRLLVGFSGSGKTAWASQVALHIQEDSAYFDIGDLPGTAVAPSLARELAARFLASRDEGLVSVLLPGSSGLQSLSALSMALGVNHATPTVFLDNVHRVAPAAIRQIIQVTPNVHYVLLAQPWSGQAELEALLGIASEELGGWSEDTIAAEFAASDCPITPATATRLRRVTSGLPLYVRNAAHLTRESYSRRADRFCDDVESRNHLETTAQEAVLAGVVEILPPDTRDVMAILAIADVPLTRDEIGELAHATLGVDSNSLLPLLRQLLSLGIIRLLGNQHLILHDAFRIVAVQRLATMPRPAVSQANRTLAALLGATPHLAYDAGRFGLYLRLLPEVGELATLADLAQSEFFLELGMGSLTRATLEQACTSPLLTIDDRYWALDTLAFWCLQEGDLQGAERYLESADALLRDLGDPDREHSALSMKRMLVKARRGDRAGTIAARDDALAHCCYRRNCLPVSRQN